MLSRFLDCRRLYNPFKPKAGYFIYHFNILQGKLNWKYINERPCFQKFKFVAIKSLHDHWLSFLTSSYVLYVAHLVLPKNKQHFDWKISRKRRILWTIWLRKTRDSSCVNFNTAPHGTKKRQDVNNASFFHIRFKLASLLEFPFQSLFLYTSRSSLDMTS